MNLMVIFLLAGVLIIAGLMLALIMLSSKRGKRHLNVEYYRCKCLEIEHQLKADNPHTYSTCVINGDKLVDHALKERGARGSTMGERLKSFHNVIRDNNGIWTAHKLRNRIAHEPDSKVSYAEARQALSEFRKALKDLGAI